MNTVINLQYTTFTDSVPDFIYEGLKEYSRNANGYKFQPQELNKKLAQKHKLPHEWIYLTAGADEALQMFALAYGQSTYFFTPTYVVYTGMKDFNANTHAINALHDNTYEIPTDTIKDSTLFYIANPNNPFGFTSKEKIIEFIDNNKHAMIVLDEVYAEFADISFIDSIEKYPNVAILRSFSKAYGMAGNRVGYIVAHPDIIKKVKNKTQEANVSYLSMGAAMIALDHIPYFLNRIHELEKRRAQFITFLKEKPIKVFPSIINAVLMKFETEKQGTHFVKYLNENNFVISHGNGNSNVGLDTSYVRISIGREEEMKMIRDIIDTYSFPQ